MTNAEHIFTWARNDGALCSAMVAARAYPEGKNFSSSRASQVFEIARASLRDMFKCGEDVAEYTASDILQAAVLMLEWDGES